MTAIGIIPARAGSRRIPMKNVRLFHGKPILAYSIETARASGVIDKVYVSTEGAAVAAVARAYGALIHNRPRALADDDVGTQAVMRSALRWWISCHQGKVPEYACCIYATAPLLLPSDLRQGLNCLMQSKWPAYVYPVDREDNDIGAFYWGRTEAFLNGVPLQGNSCLLTMPASRCCDINTPDDWERAERLYSELQTRKETTT